MGYGWGGGAERAGLGLWGRMGPVKDGGSKGWGQLRTGAVAQDGGYRAGFGLWGGMGWGCGERLWVWGGMGGKEGRIGALGEDGGS